ncbi:PP2C family protein-serine/threonine phosphatase [Streptomyces sp. NPDC020490]|uniref:PP2C family protein-serine/threonine phosphatase n=1 Tax=Streptomyces sp. NPDC020490 TaxID=3365078 RepID=UPI00378E811C
MVERQRVATPRPGLADRFTLEQRAVAAIGTTPDERGTAAECARFLVGELCDAAAVDLLTRQEDPRARRGALRAAAAAGRRDLLDGLRHVPRRNILVRALDAGHPITASLSLDGQEPVAALSVPLLAWDRAYGVVLAVRAGRAFDDGEAAAVHYAARLTAAHLHHAAHPHPATSTHPHPAAGHRPPRDTAPPLAAGPPAGPGRPHPRVEVATRFVPAGPGTAVGGDWFETVRLRQGRTLLVVGDVMGHGLDAAVDMNAYRSTLRYAAAAGLPPHRVLRRMDAIAAADAGRRPATCLLALLDPAGRSVALAAAGHLPPAVFHPDGTGELLPLPAGPPLGAGPADHTTTTLPLGTGDTLVMFTDGLVERRGEDIDTSLSRLARLRLHPGLDAGQVLDEVVARLATPRADDDIAVLTARLRPRPG